MVAVLTETGNELIQLFPVRDKKTPGALPFSGKSDVQKSNIVI